MSNKVDNMQQSPNADSLTVVSGILAFISISTFQQYVSIGAGLIAIGSGVAAMIYYIKKIKEK